MATFENVLLQLQTSHAGLTLETVDRASTAHADDDRYPDQMIGVDVEGVLIVDPYFSSCGRFYADPQAAHGIPRSLADALLHINCSFTQSRFMKSYPSQFCFIHFHRITEELVSNTAATDDLNDALFAFQNHIGINAGDVAGIVFGGGWEEEWPTATLSRRREMMDHYTAIERHYAEQ